MAQGIRASVLVAAALLIGGCHTTAPQGASCMVSADCAAGTGVCRGGTCTPTPCADSSKCNSDETCTNGMCAPSTGTKCAQDTDCPPSQGVCRNGLCSQVPCGSTMACLGDEQCVSGKCAAPTKGTPGRTLAAGGSVSTSGKHIHIGLTGQGRAVGTGSSPQHTHTTGATSVMRRQ